MADTSWCSCGNSGGRLPCASCPATSWLPLCPLGLETGAFPLVASVHPPLGLVSAGVGGAVRGGFVPASRGRKGKSCLRLVPVESDWQASLPARCMQGMRLSRIGVKEKQLMSAQEMKRQCAVFAAPPRAFANTFSSFFLASYVHMSARGAPRRAAIGSRSRSRSRSQLRDVRVQL